MPPQTAKAARDEAASSIKAHLIDQNFPPAVTIAFMNEVRRAAGLASTDRTFECPHTRKAAEAQASLGSKAVLRGHIHTEWFHAIERTYKTRTYPPNTPTSSRRRDKAPEELCAILVRAVWDFFEEVWKARNEHAYGGAGTTNSELAPELTSKLLHFKRNADTLLHYGDRNWIMQPNDVIGS